MKEYVIDATNKKLGRVASEAAVVLMGKDSPEYQPNKYPNIRVKITNTSKAAITEKKKGEKAYKRFTGYPGGLRERKMEQEIEKHGYSKLFEKAVYGMLPGNRLRSRMMLNLVISE